MRHIYCVGRNYAEHAKEMGGDATKEPPFFFTKSADAVVPVVPPAVGRVPYPLATKNLHHEIELVVAIGGRGAEASRRSARSSLVCGYAVGLDMTRRDLQNDMREKKRPWDIGKSFAERGADRRRSIRSGRSVISRMARSRSTSTVRGGRQGDLADMIWDVPHTLAFLSQFYELLPGDLDVHRNAGRRGAVVAGDRLEGGIDGLTPLAIVIAPPVGVVRVAGIVYTPEFVERGYNNRAAVPEHPQWFERYAATVGRGARPLRAARSICATAPDRRRRSTCSCPRARRAGRSCSSTAATGARSTRADFSFVAPPFLAQDIAVAVVNYDLCPDVTVADDRRRVPSCARVARPRRRRARRGCRRGSSSRAIRQGAIWWR